MHQYLWLDRELHIKKASAQLTKTSLSASTEVMASSHHIYSDPALTHPLCPSKSANKALHQTCWPAWSVSWSQGLFHLRCWAGALAGNQGEQYLAGEKGFPLLRKKKSDHSSSSCSSPSPALVPQKKAAATLPPPIVVLRLWGNICHLQFYWSSPSLFALPAPITPNNKVILAQHPEKEA